MKFHHNEKYASIAIYACIISALTVVVIMAGFHFSSVTARISDFLHCFDPILIGFVIAYLVNPAMKFLEKRVFVCRKKGKKEYPRLRRILSLIAAYLLYALVIGLLLALVIPQVAVSYRDLLSRISDYAQSVGDLIGTVSEKFPFINTEKITSALQNFFSDSYSLLLKLTPHLTGFVSGAISQLTNAFLGLVLSVYFLLYRDRLCAQCRKLTRAVFPAKACGYLENFLHETDVTFGGFIRGKLLDSLIIGVLTLVVLAIFRMPYFQLVAVIVGVTNIIPFFGPFIGAVPSALIIFIADPMKALWFLVIILIIQQLDGNVIGPRILGQSTGLSSLGVIIAIIVMGGLFGFGGMFIGVPLFALIQSLFRRFLVWRLARRGLDQDGNPLPDSHAGDEEGGI